MSVFETWTSAVIKEAFYADHSNTSPAPPDLKISTERMYHGKVVRVRKGHHNRGYPEIPGHPRGGHNAQLASHAGLCL